MKKEATNATPMSLGKKSLPSSEAGVSPMSFSKKKNEGGNGEPRPPAYQPKNVM